jgi:hypothetical protein
MSIIEYENKQKYEVKKKADQFRNVIEEKEKIDIEIEGEGD